MVFHDMPSTPRLHRRLILLVAIALSASAAGPSPWKTAPSPPASWERGRVADLENRRNAVRERMGERAMLILYAAEPRNYAGDVDWPYRQENDYFYLTGITQAGGTLVLLSGTSGIREILFLPPSNPARESWTGHILTHDEARQVSGIHEVWDSGSLNAFLAALIPRAPVPAGAAAKAPPVDVKQAFEPPSQLYMLLPPHGEEEYRREQEFAGKLAAAGAGLPIKDASPIFNALRQIKSARELDLIRHAIAITAEAFQRTYTLGVPDAWEYEIQAQFEFTFLRRNGHWGYPCIVASGKNATTLHYQTDKDRMAAGDLLLMDDGAEFDGYSADVTRTIPVSGKFTAAQADIYRLVWEAHEATVEAARPGPATAMLAAANRVFKEGLFRLGLTTDATSDWQMRLWFNHGVSHNIGLNVHDPGGPKFEPGMIVTAEPGLYFRPDALDNLPKTPDNEKFIAAVRPAFEKYKGIGVRIEDDVLITDAGPQVLTAEIPARLEDVEAAIAEWRKTAKRTPLP
jgi:Xaa-Pro aminopeptidase